MNKKEVRRDIQPSLGKFDEETKEDREHQYQLFKQREKRRYQIGKIIVYSIASIHMISTLVSAFIDFNLFTLIIQLALGIALFAGVTWVRYLFVFGAALSVFIGIAVLLKGGYGTETWLIWLVIIHMIYGVLASVLLLIHSGVKEFLYSQKNG